MNSDLIKQYSDKIDLKELAKSDLNIRAYVGIDIGSISDINTVSVMIKSDEKFYFKTYIFVPEETLKTNKNCEKYKEWANNNYIIVTKGNVSDYDVILLKLIEINNIIKIKGIFYDPWNAVCFLEKTHKLGLPLYSYTHSPTNVDWATAEFARLFMNGCIVIDYNPVVFWCFENCMLYLYDNENVHSGCYMPKKIKSKSGPIAAVISMIVALGGHYTIDKEISWKKK